MDVKASYQCSFSDQASGHTRHGRCSRSYPLSWCRTSHSRHFQWCTHRCLQEAQKHYVTYCWHLTFIWNENIFLCSGRTNAAQPVLSRFVACVAGALVAADHVDTLAIAAQPVTQLTFIDICEITKQWLNTRFLSNISVKLREPLASLYDG